jgi:hypothetical protein
MAYSISSIFVLMVVMTTTHSALAQTPPNGEYLTSSGSLSIRPGKGGSSTFQIDTVGANFHLCSLNGMVKDGMGYVEDEEKSEPQCLILFTIEKGRINVSTQSDSACRRYCGARAMFEGTYLLPPAGCKLSVREVTRKSFLASYRSKDYSHAYDTLNEMYQQCHDFLNRVEIDSVRNDLAIAQFHLGHKEACLDILKDTIGATQTDEDKLSETRMPPGDFYAYLPIAKATWHNLKLCRSNNSKEVTK